jgi:hypothetical protein
MIEKLNASFNNSISNINSSILSDNAEIASTLFWSWICKFPISFIFFI